MQELRTVLSVKEGAAMKRILHLCCVVVMVLSCSGGGGGGGGGGNQPVSPNIATTDLEDIEGNKYGVSMIGNQIWMTENLRTVTFRNGAWMLTGPYDSLEWAAGLGAASCIYPHASVGLSSAGEVITAYGRLYNWNAVNDSRGLCPEGWHVPTRADWEELIAHLGGESVAGGKLKSTRTDPITGHPRWDSPNTGASDYAFHGLPGGLRSGIGEFLEIGQTASFWSSTESGSFAGALQIFYDSESAIYYPVKMKASGFSVRCIHGN